MATTIPTTTDFDAADFGCRAGKIGVNWANQPDAGDLSYVAATGALTHVSSTGVSTTVNLPVENFLSAASYDNGTGILTLTLTDASTVTVNIGDLIDTYALAVTDTSCIDLTLSGDGSTGNPWSISAAPVIDPSADNGLVCGVNGLFAAATVVQAADTSCVDTTVSGLGTTSSPYIVSSAPVIDPSADNGLACGVNGLYAPQAAVSVSDTSCIDMSVSGSGLASDPFVLSATPIIDAAANNVLSCGASGLLVDWTDVQSAIAADTFDCSALPAI